MSKPTFKISASVEGNQGVIRIDGRIANYRASADIFRQQLDSLIASNVPSVLIYINSMGGDVFEANEIANDIFKYKGEVIAQLGAICASAATYIASRCSYVKAMRNTQEMIHKPMGELSGNADEIESQLKLLRNLQGEYLATYAAKTGLAPEKLEAMWVEDYWMNAQEARQLGFIDEIIDDEANISEEEVNALQASGYKNTPKISATLNTNHNKNEMNHLKIVAAALGLLAEASEAQIMAKIEENKIAAAKVPGLQADVERLTKAANEAKIEALLDTHQNKKKFLPAQRAFYKESLEKNFEGTKAHLESLPEVTALSSRTEKQESTEDRSNWSYKDYQDKAPEALAELAKKDEAKFRALFKAHYGHELGTSN